MTNVGKLNKNLREFANLERALWVAFKRAQKEYLPPTLNIVKSWGELNGLVRDGFLSRKFHYPAYLLASLVSAFAVILISFWFLIPYGGFFAAAMHSRSKFVEAFAKRKLGESDFDSFAFGIDQPSLIVAGMVRLREAGSGKLNQEAIQSILKIQKASADFSDVSIGVGEAVKKFLFSVPFLAAAWIYGNSATFNRYAASIQDVAVKNWPVALFLAFFALSALFIAYDLVLGQTFNKRQKKKYVLALTLMAEGFAQR